MSGMWSGWARRRRLAGLTFLTGAAVATAAAVLLFTLGVWPFTILFGVLAVALIVLAGIEFAWARKYAQLEA